MDMKNREDFIKNCCYPVLPDNSGSIYRLSHSNKKERRIIQGGRLTESISVDSFVLSSQFHKIKYFVSEDCRLFFTFDEKSKNISWKEVFSLLRAGDHLMAYVQNDIIQTNSFTKSTSFVHQNNRINCGVDIEEKEDTVIKTIHNINKVVLVSVNTKNKVLSSSSIATQLQKDWFKFLDWTHQAMAKIKLDRVETSTLVDCPGTEPDLDLFEIEFSQTDRKSIKLFLTTSPEMQMKRLLCRGWTDIYEIKKCFRNNESGPVNCMEFYLLEWYRAYSSLEILIKDICFLLNFLSKKIKHSSFPKLKKVSMAELFKKYLNMELHPHSSKKDFINELDKRDVPYKESDDISDLFYLLFLNGVEPYLSEDIPLIIYDYPPFQKAYARIGPKGWANRFELFWKGMELANAFDEVIESEEQKKRFAEDGLQRELKGKQNIPPAYKLLNDMKVGMPPSAGVALGLERLFLAFKGLDDIQCFKTISETDDHTK